MFIPASFVETDRAKLHDFIESNSFGLLVSQADDAPFATHLPFLLERAAGPHGALIGHLSRANLHWRHIVGRTSLSVFSGPHAYISPTWYEAENVVPTWNYAAVHAYGRAQLVEDRDGLLEILHRSVAMYEAALPRPWTFDASGPLVDRLLGGIVGFRIEIDRLEGKWKMNQNHPADRRNKVVKALRGQGGENSSAVADMVQQTIPVAPREEA